MNILEEKDIHDKCIMIEYGQACIRLPSHLVGRSQEEIDEYYAIVRPKGRRRSGKTKNNTDIVQQNPM
jgi:hypothetical protein